ncbi:MAG: S-layer homology domain-containing protein, partial [Chloroflexi bacterium]|nr:S-layer homology domain-containing protein [Chloroflexota bacterium]
MWAVGNSYDGVNEPVTLIEHWDGNQWSIVPSPNVGSSTNDLYGIASVSGNDIWSVGTWFDDSQLAEQTLALHWDGTAWNVVPTPNGRGPNYLFGIAAVSANDVWAVGQNGVPPEERTLAMHWDGTRWSVDPSPSVGLQANELLGVAVVSTNDLWAVGHYVSTSADYTLIERYNDPCVTPTPSATSSSTATAPPTETSTPAPGTTETATIEVGTATETATTQATACTITFNDVPPSNTFYANIECLACKGIISGYDDGTFRPNNQVTRGQIAKIVSNSADIQDDPGAQIYTDVPPSNPFYPYINRLTHRNVMGGYDCGMIPQEPCDTQN